MAPESPTFSKLFGEGSTFQQLLTWQVLAQVIAAVGAPGLTALTQLVESHAPINALSVADAVDAALKGHIPVDKAIAEASLSGISAERFRLLLASAGAPPGAADLASALRRGLIEQSGEGPDSTSFEQGIRESRMNPKWTDIVRELAVYWPSPVDILDALLEGQVTMDEGRALYERVGGDLEFFTLLYNTRGSAPTPVEAATMAMRGIIPWEGTGPEATTFDQAGLEGPWRNKWIPKFRALAEYLPPPRTVTAMIANGSLTDDQGMDLLEKQGLTPELAAAYVADAHHVKTQQTRLLAKTDVLNLYKAKEIDRATAAPMLGQLGYTPPDQQFELDYADFQVSKGLIDQAISRMRSLFLAHKTDSQGVITALDAIGVPADQRNQLLQTWGLERDAEVKILTAAEVCDAVFYELEDAAWGLQQLIDLGYPPDLAWLRLGIRLHGAPPVPRPA